MMMSELVEAQRGTLLNTTDRVLGSAVSKRLTHIGKLSGNDSGDFPETFSKNRWRVGAPKHDITANLLSYLIKIFEFKADWIEKSG